MLGFVGAGAMGGAIISGLLSSKAFSADDIVITASSPERSRQLAAQFGVQACDSAQELARYCEGGTIIMAVKPYLVCSLLEQMHLDKETLVISVAASVSLAQLQEAAGPDIPVLRAMPNVGARIGHSMTALCPGSACTRDEIDTARKIFTAVGSVEEIEEKDFSLFSALAGCSPAFTALYIDALARAGVYYGFSKTMATRIAARAVEGAAALVAEQLKQGVSAADTADSVQSPGGTTVAGVVALEKNGFAPAVVQAVQASVERDRK